MPSRDGGSFAGARAQRAGIARARRALGGAAAHRERRAMRVRLELHDHHPPSFEAEGLPRRLELQRSQDRGLPGAAGGARRDRVRAAEVRLPHRWDCGGSGAGPAALEVRVYPNFRALAKYTLLATDNRLSQIGVLQVRRRGTGHQLREYRQGDAAARDRLEGDLAHRAPHLARVRGGKGPARAARGRLRPPHGFEGRRAFAFRPRAERRAASRTSRCARATRSAS